MGVRFGLSSDLEGRVEDSHGDVGEACKSAGCVKQRVREKANVKLQVSKG